MKYRLSIALAGAIGLSVGLAGPVTLNRIDALPPAQRAEWRAYLERSHSNALADLAAVQKEAAREKLSSPLRAPSGGNFKIQAKAGDDWYGTAEARGLADVVLSYQTPTGGWSKHTGYGKGPRQPGMQWSSQNEPGQPAHYVATFDNRATTEEMLFLACVWQATARDDCRAGFLKGLDFILAAQYPNGGWPQVYPLEGAYHDDVTFNDDAMTRILGLLQAVTQGEAPFSLVDEPRRRKAAEALAAGIRCVLLTQIVQEEKRTAWCAQYDPLRLEPSSARQMEPASLSGLESAHILEFLMSLPNPAPEVVTSIEGGLAWLERVKIPGLAKTRRDGKTAYEADPAASKVYWARFYDLTTSQPLFPGRDGVLYASFEAMAAQNRLGYDYLTTLPGSILGNGQKKWRKMLQAR